MNKDYRHSLTAHVDYVRSLVAVMTPSVIRDAVHTVVTHGSDNSTPVIDRLALIGTIAAPRIAIITYVGSGKVCVSYLTKSGIRHGRKLNDLNSHPIHLDGWPEAYRDNARTEYHRNPNGKRRSTVDEYAEYHYEWALKTQAVYRAITHCPWVAFAPIREATITRARLVMIPKNGEIQ